MEGRADYISRIQRVQDHIEAHLTDALATDDLAKIACFSPFHFHRIFAAVVGEPPAAYVRRLRLERAASILGGVSEASITEIALDSGFQDPATFARAFRRRFGVTASEWRKNGQALRRQGQAAADPSEYLRARTEDSMTDPENDVPRATIRIENAEPFPIAYIRHIGPYAGDSELFGRLFGELSAWVSARGLFGPDTKMVAIYHDDPEVTDEDKLRLSVGASVPPGTSAEGKVGILEVPGGRNVHARFALLPHQYAAAWRWLCGTWLPDSGFEPDDRFAYELYLGPPAEDGTHGVELVLPVRPR